MIIFRAVNIYPGQIDELLSSISDISSEYQIVLERREDGKDTMLLRVECNSNAQNNREMEIKDNIRSVIKNNIMVSCEVELVQTGSLPRSERKSKRIFDRRK